MQEIRPEALRLIVDERDRRYEARFVAIEEAVSVRFAASEKAISKAEDAQREYNVRSNEFRGQLDDQAKTLMPRPETMTMFKAIDEKIAAADLDRQRKHEVLTNEIAKLRESRSNLDGRMIGAAAVAGVVFALLTAALQFIQR